MNTPSYDTSFRPQDDFFSYINNTWLQQNPIPPTESSWGAFYVLRDAASDAVKEIFDTLENKDTQTLTHDQKLLKSYYDSTLHFDTYAASHRAHLQEQIEKIDAITTHSEFASTLGKMHRRDQSAFWAPFVDIDDKDSSLHVLRLHQAGLTLPNRDYYLDTAARMAAIRKKYEEYFEEFRSLHPAVATEFSHVSEIETLIAKDSWTPEELRDIEKNYNPMSKHELKVQYEFDWDAYFSGLGCIDTVDRVIIGQPSYLQRIVEVIGSHDMSQLKAYLKWKLLDGQGAWIDDATAKIYFNFFGTVISGVTTQKPLWKRAVQHADNLIIGEIVGREYANRHFPESSKQTVLSIVEDIRSAYSARIDKLTWMSPTTKKRAYAKLHNIKVLIGYPSVWKDFSGLELPAQNHLRLLQTLREFNTDIELKKLGTPVADEEWHMHAHTVNAYHHPNRLEIVFPAAILQPPFFDPHASYATNLGGIGAVTGHEFTHGFDDQGADFDEYGNTVRWQTPKERTKFDEMARIIVRQADKFETIPGTYLKGELVLGEAIADIGGLALAVEALEQSSSNVSKDEYRMLFESFARCECGHTTPERAVQLAKIDPHPPAKFRVNCVVCHVDAFYRTYGVTKGDALYLPLQKRAQIW